MREILFRGKRKDIGEWVEGYLYITHKGEYEISHYDKLFDVERMTRLVIPETVGQFTGLTDKNGTKIFEGDICKLENIETGFVKYGDTAEFQIVFDEGSCDFAPLSHYNVEIEVIGNIFDNPELLKGADNNAHN